MMQDAAFLLVSFSLSKKLRSIGSARFRIIVITKKKGKNCCVYCKVIDDDMIFERNAEVQVKLQRNQISSSAYFKEMIVRAIHKKRSLNLSAHLHH